jgi:hypothetical protein
MSCQFSVNSLQLMIIAWGHHYEAKGNLFCGGLIAYQGAAQLLGFTANPTPNPFSVARSDSTPPPLRSQAR